MNNVIFFKNRCPASFWIHMLKLGQISVGACVLCFGGSYCSLGRVSVKVGCTIIDPRRPIGGNCCRRRWVPYQFCLLKQTRNAMNWAAKASKASKATRLEGVSSSENSANECTIILAKCERFRQPAGCFYSFSVVTSQWHGYLQHLLHQIYMRNGFQVNFNNVFSSSSPSMTCSFILAGLMLSGEHSYAPECLLEEAFVMVSIETIESESCLSWTTMSGPRWRRSPSRNLRKRHIRQFGGNRGLK